MADLQLVNDVKFWAQKYIILSWLAGINLAFFSWHLGIKNLRKYLGIPLAFLIFFESRNIFMRNAMDKIYFPLEPVYKKTRGDDKQQLSKRESDKKENKKMSYEDEKKFKAMEAIMQQKAIEELAKKELE